MEQRPSDSPDESANELPQSVPQPPPVAPLSADEPPVFQRSEAPIAPERLTDESAAGKPETRQLSTEPATSVRIEIDHPANTQSTVVPINEVNVDKSVEKPVTSAPTATPEPIARQQTDQPNGDQPRSDTPQSFAEQNGPEQEGQSAKDQASRYTEFTTEQKTATPVNESDGEPSRAERPGQDRPGNERHRDGQPRQNQSGQSPKQSQPGQERPGVDAPGVDSPGQDRPGQDRPGQDRPGQDRPGQDRPEKQPRDSGQPQKQGQERSGQDRTRGEKMGQPNQPRQPNGKQSGHERSGQERSVNEKIGGDKSGPEKSREISQPQKQGQPAQERSGNERSGQERQPREPRGNNQSGREPKLLRETDMDGREEEDRPTDLRQPDRLTTGPREETVRESDNRLTIGITLGDYNGIGPEVILKALQNNRLQKICTPVIYGSMRILNRYRTLLEMKDWNLNGIQQVGQASHKLTNVITCWADQNGDIQPGKVTPEAGQAAFACLQRAVEDLREGRLDAIVTAPINKHNIQSEEFKFPGHTEYLADAFSVTDNLMFLVSERLRVGVVTGHVPLGRVRQNITRERILQKLTMMSQSLRLDFGIDKPRIAVLGLNPHAGEEGLLGNEEQEIVKPLIKQLQDKGNLVYGPFPADGFFGTRAYLKFDAVLAMYHDQGLIPFKAIAFEDGVNFTAAMPFVRTSPDHGTAYDIAGKNLADETSMLQAIYTACDIARRRRETAEIEAGALKPRRERERAVER